MAGIAGGFSGHSIAWLAGWAGYFDGVRYGD